MSDLDAWAEKHSFDLKRHLEQVREQGVRAIAAEIEADHKRRMRQLDAEIKRSGLMDEITVEGGALEATAPYAASALSAAEEGAPALHLRYDDSRRRGLASECICGEPGCTRWYEPFQED